MGSASTRYTPRFQLPELIERGRDEVITCPVYRSGALVAPSDGTVSVYDATGTAIVDGQAVTITDEVAHYTILSSLTADLDFGEGWWVEWLLDMPDGVTHRFRNDGALVRNRLYPTITDLDLIRRLSAFDPSSAAAQTIAGTHQDKIDEADVELQLRLIERGERPWQVATPSALRQTWLCLGIALILEDLAVHNPEKYTEQARVWREKYEAAYASASIGVDRNEDGAPDNPQERKAIKPAAVWLQ